MVIALALAPTTVLAQGFGTPPAPKTPGSKPGTPPSKPLDLPPPAPATPPQDAGKADADKGKRYLVNDMQPAFDAIKAKDWVGAEKFLLPKATIRDPRAQFLLGSEVYGNRESKLYDPKKGIPLIKDSAERGFARSMLFYGISYADGAGLPRDMVEAYKWTALASRRGVPEAGIFLSEMAKNMSPDQIERAKAAADKFAPQR